MTSENKFITRRAALGLIFVASMGLARGVRAEPSPAIHVSKDPS